VASEEPTLSLCMIVRDEAGMLPGCLESARGAVDEIVIVDTGSTDHTPRIARQHGARVLHHQWREDFSEARNVSLAHATCGWVLWLDADERLRPAEHGRLRGLLARGSFDAYLVPILSRTPTGSQVTRGHRLFRNDPRVRFSGRVHEQVSPAIARMGGRTGLADFTIEHLGYDLPEERLREKYLRNLRLLSLAKESDPRDAYVRFMLAQAHLLLNQIPEAERELRAALGEVGRDRMGRLPPDIRAAAYNNLAQCALSRGAPCEALARARTSLALAPRQVTAHLMAYRAFRALDQQEDALGELLAVEGLLDRPGQAGTAVEVVVARPDLWRAMGYCCLRLNRPSEARDYFMRALEGGSQKARTMAALARCCIAEGAHREALRYAEAAHRLAPEDDGLLDLLSFVLLKQGRFSQAAERLRQLSLRRPGDQQLRRRLAGVLVKAGRTREAAELLAQGSPPPGARLPQAETGGDSAKAIPSPHDNWGVVAAIPSAMSPLHGERR